jgi:hypothetical protein
VIELVNNVPAEREETNMVITLTPELEADLNELARRRGVATEVLVLSALRDWLLAVSNVVNPGDEWENLILQAGTNCGVSLPHDAVGSEGLYE